MSLLRVRNLTKVFGGLVAVNDLSFEVEQGEILGIIGPNGAGKTTAFAAISGFQPPTSGTIHFNGTLLNGLRPDQICRLGLTRTFQVVQTFPNMTALENVMVGAFLRYPSPREAEGKSKEMLDLFGMGDKANVEVRHLTLVDHKRLEIAKAIATEPQLVLVDEVMAGLRPSEVEEAVSLIRMLRERGITFLVIEHVMRAIMALSERIIVLHHGEKIAEGSPTEISRNNRVIEAYLGEDALLA